MREISTLAGAGCAGEVPAFVNGDALQDVLERDGQGHHRTVSGACHRTDPNHPSSGGSPMLNICGCLVHSMPDKTESVITAINEIEGGEVHAHEDGRIVVIAIIIAIIIIIDTSRYPDGIDHQVDSDRNCRLYRIQSGDYIGRRFAEMSVRKNPGPFT